MHYPNTTQVPNRFFDHLLPCLTHAETKILLVIIRQTYGWLDRHTGKRKQRDCISYAQFMQKTGLSRRILTETMKGLVAKKAIFITDFKGAPLPLPQDRAGGRYLFYSANLTLVWPQSTKQNPYNKKIKHIGHVIQQLAF